MNSSHTHKTRFWFLFGVLFKISGNHPSHFYMGVPLPPLPPLRGCYTYVKVEFCFYIMKMFYDIGLALRPSGPQAGMNLTALGQVPVSQTNSTVKPICEPVLKSLFQRPVTDEYMYIIWYFFGVRNKDFCAGSQTDWMIELVCDAGYHDIGPNSPNMVWYGARSWLIRSYRYCIFFCKLKWQKGAPIQQEYPALALNKLQNY